MSFSTATVKPGKMAIFVASNEPFAKEPLFGYDPRRPILNFFDKITLIFACLKSALIRLIYFAFLLILILIFIHLFMYVTVRASYIVGKWSALSFSLS